MEMMKQSSKELVNGQVVYLWRYTICLKSFDTASIPADRFPKAVRPILKPYLQQKPFNKPML